MPHKLNPHALQEVQERSGMSQQYIGGLERGQRNPTVISVYVIAQALGVNHMELLQPDTKQDQQPQASDSFN